tara:strand:- start:1198 stop:3210 length:2013 start_codon:yes stop_codon:yes gene_type:complete
MNNPNTPPNNDAQRIGVKIKDKISEIEASIQGIKAGEMAQEKEGLPEEWVRDGEVENRIRDFIQAKHTFTSDDVWEELLDPLIRNGEIPPVDNRRIIGPMFKRLVEDGLAIDSQYAIRSKRRNGALMRVYRIPNSTRSKFLRGEFIANPEENATLKKSSEDLKKSMEIEAEQIKKLEKQLDDARRRQTQDESLRNRFKESGYNRHGRRSTKRLDERLSKENYQYYPPLKADTATPIEVDGNEYQVYLFDEMGATGKKINYPSSLDLTDMLNISLIVKNQNDETIGEIVLQLEDKAGGMGYSLLSDGFTVSNHVSGQPIGYRAVGYSNPLPSNQYLMNQIAQKYIPLLGKKMIEGNDYSGFVNDTLKFLPYDESMIRFNDYIMDFVAREEFEDLFGASTYDELVRRNMMKTDRADADLIQKLNEFEAEKAVEGKMENTTLRDTLSFEYIITPAFYEGLDSSDKSILKTLVDWINGKDPIRAEMAERQLIAVLQDMDKRYDYPNWAFVSSGLLDMISEEDWYEQVLKEAYAKEGEDEVNDLLDTDLLQTLMDTPTGNQKIRKEWDVLIGNMASRSVPFPENNDAWETRTDDSAIEAKMRDLKGIANLNMGNLNRRYLKTYFRNINGRRYVATRPIRNPKPIAQIFRNQGYNARIIPTADGKRIYLAKKRFRN